MDLSILEQLTQLAGVSGREDAVRQYIAEQLPVHVQNVRTDVLGNLLAFVPGTGKHTVLLCAHMDEVGLMVRYVSAEGFVYFVPVGGIDPRTLLAQRVCIHTAQGDVPGVIGTKPAHVTTEAERGKAVPLTDLYIDTGLSGEAAVAQIQPGDAVTLERSFLTFGKGRISAKALDNRLGCFCVLEALKRVPLPVPNVQVVFSAQEEVGLRGAEVAAFGLEADIALAVDTTGAADIPSCRPQDYLVRLGGGVGISALDACTITPRRLFDSLTDLCCREHLPYQVRVAPRGGNDAGVLHRSRTGMAACALSVPVRNIHSNVEVADISDITAATDLLCAVLQGGLSALQEQA